MIKVKNDLIKKVICEGCVVTRRFMYYCPGRVDLSPLDPEPVVYVVVRVKQSDGFVEVVGLFDVEGKRL